MSTVKNQNLTVDLRIMIDLTVIILSDYSHFLNFEFIDRNFSIDITVLTVTLLKTDRNTHQKIRFVLGNQYVGP